MKQSLRRLPVALLALLGVIGMVGGGCSQKFQLPWEKDMLDPGRVATREPLEIPPDLQTLPPAETTGTGVRRGRSGGDSATSILFQEGKGEKRVEQRGQERAPMPDWVTNPRSERPSEKKDDEEFNPLPPGRQKSKPTREVSGGSGGPL